MRCRSLACTLLAAALAAQGQEAMKRGARPPQTPAAAKPPAVLKSPAVGKPSASTAAPQANITLGFDQFRCQEAVGNYYAGGRGDSGTGPGPNYGITFSPNAIVLWDYFVYPYCGDNVSQTTGFPSQPNGVFFLEGDAATMNVPAGFTGGFSFYYSAAVAPGIIRVWSEVNGTGTALTSLSLPSNGSCDPAPYFCYWTPIGVSFQGVAKSVDFGGVANQIVFDNITLGTSVTGTTQPAKAYGDVTNQPNCPCNAAGDPISISTGNLFESVTDYQTAGPNPLGFTRYYNSGADGGNLANSMGRNWRHNFDRFINIQSSFAVSLERADGQIVTFVQRGSSWQTDSDIELQLTKSGSTWTLTDSSDTVETYTTASATQALLTSIRQRNGYTQRMTRDSNNLLNVVSDSYNRKLQFQYQGGTLQSVTMVDGLTVSYGYDGTNRLTTVSYSTDPPASKTYLYENPNLQYALTGIIDENGVRQNTWAYDAQGRAISSQHAGGADLTTISYSDADSTRTVTNALGLKFVYRLAALQNMYKVVQIDRAGAGANSAASLKFTYDKNGYIDSRTDWNGHTTTYENDVRGQPLTIVEAGGTNLIRTTKVTYHPKFHLPASITIKSLVTTFQYDANGNLKNKTETDIKGEN